MSCRLRVWLLIRRHLSDDCGLSQSLNGLVGTSPLPGALVHPNNEPSAKYLPGRCLQRGFPGGTSGKEPACQSRRLKRPGFDPWVGKIPWRRKCNPLQYSCLDNPMDRGAWRATVHRVAKSRTRLKRLSMHTRHVCLQTGFCILLTCTHLPLSMSLFSTTVRFSECIQVLPLFQHWNQPFLQGQEDLFFLVDNGI